MIGSPVLPNGHPTDMFLFGITISTSAITIVTLKLALETKCVLLALSSWYTCITNQGYGLVWFGVGSTWTVFHHLVFWGSLSVYFLFISLYGLIPHVRGWDNHIYWAFCTCSSRTPLGEICDRQPDTANHLGYTSMLSSSSRVVQEFIVLVDLHHAGRVQPPPRRGLQKVLQPTPSLTHSLTPSRMERTNVWAALMADIERVADGCTQCVGVLLPPRLERDARVLAAGAAAPTDGRLLRFPHAIIGSSRGQRDSAPHQPRLATCVIFSFRRNAFSLWR
jgi:hypothetical protein